MKIFKKMAIAFVAGILTIGISAVGASAAEGEEITNSKGLVIGNYDAEGQIIFHPDSKNAHNNVLALNELCRGSKEKTIVISDGTTVKVDAVIYLGSNTTIKADGATIIQTIDGKGILANDVTKSNYGSIENVTIQGGTWKNAKNKHIASMMRFAHGQNMTIDKVTVITNYEGHAVELIAMKNVTVRNSTLKAEGKARKDSVEEALQIDIATPLTAPGIARAYGKKFTNGETCKNIKVLDNTITGGRGICANFASREKKYINKFHDNITIIGNKVTGKSAEGVALFNTLNSTVRNNTIVSNSSRKKETYSIGLNIFIIGSSTRAKKATVTVQGNTIRGGKQGMQISSKTSSKYKKAVVKKNKLSASSGQALLISSQGVSKILQSGNKNKK